MGNPRPRPNRLGEKLRQIRMALDLSQSQMPERLGVSKMHAGRISQYENDQREPTLMTLLAYSQLAGVHLEDIVNDKIDLPDKLPGKVRQRGL